MEVLKVAHGACVSVKTGELKARDIRAVVETYLKMRCNQLSPDRPRIGVGNKFQGEVKRSLFGSSEWDAHLTERLEALTAQPGLQEGANGLEEPFARQSVPEDPSPPDVVRNGAKPTGGQVGGESENVFRRTDQGLLLRFVGEEASGLKWLKGMTVIQGLLRSASRPGEEPVSITSATLENPDSEPFVHDHGAPIIDLSRIQAQKQDLVEEIQQARACGDEGREARAEQQIDVLLAHMRKNTDKHGRPRRLGSRAEKVRQRVLENWLYPSFPNGLST